MSKTARDEVSPLFKLARCKFEIRSREMAGDHHLLGYPVQFTAKASSNTPPPEFGTLIDYQLTCCVCGGQATWLLRVVRDGVESVRLACNDHKAEVQAVIRS